MVDAIRNVTGFSRSGMKDWLIQRLTAVVLAAYVIFLLVYFICNPDLDYATWKHLFASVTVQIFTFITLLCLLMHAWIGMWTVVTDYIKSAFARLIVQSIFILALFSYLYWGIKVLWSL